jgi:hypothetical protein
MAGRDWATVTVGSQLGYLGHQQARQNGPPAETPGVTQEVWVAEPGSR